MLSFNQFIKICLTPQNLMIYIIILDLNLLLLLTDFILYLVELSLLPYRISNDFRFNWLLYFSSGLEPLKDKGSPDVRKRF